MNASSINSATDARRLLAGEMATASGSTPKAQLTPEQQKARQTASAAKQFEAIILRQLLSPAIEPLMSNGLGGGGGNSGGGVYGYMLTDVLAGSLSQAGGLGLSKMLQQQLAPTGAAAAKAAAAYQSGKVNVHE
jgi:Rod binding domain-containing protein